MDTYYTPRTTVTRVLNALFMRRKFAGTVDEIMHGLAELAEERKAADRSTGPTAKGNKTGTVRAHVAHAPASLPSGTSS
jgi:hypothetical protein